MPATRGVNHKFHLDTILHDVLMFADITKSTTRFSSEANNQYDSMYVNETKSLPFISNHSKTLKYFAMFCQASTRQFNEETLTLSRLNHKRPLDNMYSIF